MSELPGRDYAEVHRQKLSGLLDMSQEIAWSQPPHVYLETKGEELIRSRVANLADLPEVEREFQANADTELGMMVLTAFRARATIILLSDMREREESDPWQMDDRATANRRAFERTRESMDEAEAQYSFMSFQSTASPESVDIYFLKLQGAEDEIEGRELRIVREDAVLAYTFIVTEAGWADSAQPPKLKTRQEVAPQDDEEMNEITDFFIGLHDDSDSYSDLIIGFVHYLQGNEPDFTKVLSRYEGPEKDKVQGYIARLHQRAINAQFDSRLLREHPCLGLPTEQDIDMYGDILAQIRRANQ